MAEDEDQILIRSNVFWKLVACRGFHIYNGTVWPVEEQFPGKEVFIDKETSIESRAIDPYCCAVRLTIRGSYICRAETVGHILRELSRYVYYFLELGGMVDGKVWSMQKRRSPIPSGGLEVCLKLYFRHTSISLVEQLKGFIARYDYNWGQPEAEPDPEDSD